MWLDNVLFEDKVIEDERLELSDKKALYHLGPNLILRRCTLVLRVPANHLLLPGPRFIDCTIEVKKELKNLPWYTAFLKGCRFTGRLTGCDFGRRPDPELPHRDVGGIEACDFTAAQLRGCRFVGCDTNTLRFPSWPYFTILEPYRRAPELDSIEWPGQLNTVMHRFAEFFPEETVALTESATDLARQYGTTEAAIKEVLSRMEGVKY